MIFFSGLGKRNEQSQINLPEKLKYWILKFVQINILCWKRQTLLKKYVLRIPRIFQMRSKKQAESGGCFQIVSSAVYRLGF